MACSRENIFDNRQLVHLCLEKNSSHFTSRAWAVLICALHPRVKIQHPQTLNNTMLYLCEKVKCYNRQSYLIRPVCNVYIGVEV
jgi:hypothetical protein